METLHGDVGGPVAMRTVLRAHHGELVDGRNQLGAGLSSHVVGIFEKFGQAQYPQKCRKILRGNLLKGYLQLIAELVGFGGTENMFGKNFLNRVVILE